METLHTQLQRVRFTSSKSFDDVIAGFFSGISRPDVSDLIRRIYASRSLDEFKSIVNGSLEGRNFLEFLHLDVGKVISIGPSIASCRMVRMLVGNPLILRELAGRVPDAASYVPVTILVYELDSLVNVCYDQIASVLAAFDSEETVRIGAEVDKAVIELIKRAID